MKLLLSIFNIGTFLTYVWGIPAEPAANNEPECYGGGMEQYPPLSGPNTPPCWYKQSDGKYHCYDYNQGTSQCPWPGYEDPKPGNKNPAECYGGGMRQYPPLVNPNTPPCWYKQSDGKYDCYDYNQGTNQCPWPGYEDPKPGNKKPAECYGGGIRQNPPLVNPNTPPCWYKQSDGKYDCYDYNQGTNQCPWSGYENPKPQ